LPLREKVFKSADDLYNRLLRSVSPEMQTNDEIRVFLRLLAEETYIMYDLIWHFPEVIDVDYTPEDFLPFIAESVGYYYRNDVPADLQRMYIRYMRAIYKVRGSLWSLAVTILLEGRTEEVIMDYVDTFMLRLNELWYPHKWEPGENEVITWADDQWAELGGEIPYGIILVEHALGPHKVKLPFDYVEHVRPGGIRLDLIRTQDYDNMNFARGLWFTPMRMVELAYLWATEQRLDIQLDYDMPLYLGEYKHFLEDFVSVAAPQPAVIIRHPQDKEVSHGDSVTFNVIASGTMPISYRWQRSDDEGDTWKNLTGSSAYSSAYTISTVRRDKDHKAMFRCRVWNAHNVEEELSQEAELTITAEVPIIRREPSDVEVKQGEDASFSVRVESGDYTPTFAWERSDDDGASWGEVEVDDSSDTESTVKVEEADYPVDNGALYRCRIWNPFYPDEEVVTREALLTVKADPPEIVSTSGDRKVEKGGDVSFWVRVEGTETLNYKWQVSEDDGGSWQDIDGEDGQVGSGSRAYLFLEGVGVEENQNLYRCYVENMKGEAVSEGLKLTVFAKPEITKHPEDVEAAVGDNVAFDVEAVGTEPLEYLWQRRISHGSPWENLGDWASMDGGEASYEIADVDDSYDRNFFRCRVRNDHGEVASDHARLYILGEPPSIVEDLPSSKTVAVGESVELGIVAEGDSPLRYTWSYSDDGGASWEAIGGAEEATYTISEVTMDHHERLYRCQVSNDYGSATSNECEIVVETDGLYYRAVVINLEGEHKGETKFVPES